MKGIGLALSDRELRDLLATELELVTQDEFEKAIGVSQRRRIPIERAVPATDFMAASSDSQFRSGSFVLAISSTCFFVTVPTFVLFGSAEPFARFAARFSRIDAGGVFVMKV